MANKNSVHNSNEIIDNAFVPDMQNKEPLTAEQKMAALFASMSGNKVTTPTLADPDNGEHSVVITSYELHNGYRGNSDYFVISLKEPSKNITWDMTLPAEPGEMMAFLGDINMYNNGMLYRLEPMKAFDRLQKREFKVWTQQFKTDKNERRVKTYVNPVKYEKFARYISWKGAEVEKAEEAYKAHKEAEKK